MRTLVGVDEEGHYASALDLLGRLRFAGGRATLAHVDPAVEAEYNPLLHPSSPVSFEEPPCPDGQEILQKAVRAARSAGLGRGLDTAYAFGKPSTTLMELAEECRADLVAIGARAIGCAEGFSLGSVGRALAINGRQSFLVGRGAPKGRDSILAVFATDHSEYADRCFERLLEMDPQGLAFVSIVTATGEGEAMGDACKRRGGQAMAARLEAKGIGADFRLLPGPLATELREVMDRTQADLMILCARGHGLLERLLVGSVALHAVVAEPYPVLVLRTVDSSL